MFKSNIIYPIRETKEEKDEVLIKAGKEWIDEKRVIQYEGVELKLPKKSKEHSKIIFAVTMVWNVDLQNYALGLHTHEGECCELDGEMIVSKKMMMKLTGISDKSIRHAIEKNNITLGDTYNLLVSLPRIITLTKKEVIISRNKNPRLVDSMNVCRNIFGNNHPIDD